MKVDLETLKKLNNIYDDIVLGNSKIALNELSKIIHNEQLSIYSVSERFILMVMYNDRIIEKRISTSEKYIDDEMLINKEVYKHLPNAIFYKGLLNAH